MIEMMTLRMAAAAIACVAVFQDPAANIERAILRLSNDDAQVRARAEADLLAFGPKAIPALREASKTVGALTREAAQRLLLQIESIEFERPRDAENRKKIFARNESRESLWRDSYPLSMEGAYYRWTARSLGGGLVVTSSFLPSYLVEIEHDFKSAADKDGKEIAVKRCGKCSPGWVYVDHPGPLTLKLTGTRRWYSDLPLEFANPKNGDMLRVGDFLVTVKWPKLEVTALKPCPEEVAKKTNATFDFELKEPRKAYDTMGVGGGGGGGGRYGGRFGGKSEIPYTKENWCMCLDGPKPVSNEKPEVKTMSTWTIEQSVTGGYTPASVDEVASISFKFSKPVEENWVLDIPDAKASDSLDGKMK
ncbi:MAG TPA: hypothetical protein VFS19_06225 [Planctomycetota bacterium]|nr:hypothetical protein [Planctomycetota bacterium]